MKIIDPFERVRRLKNADPKRKREEGLQGRIPPGQYLTDKFPVLTYGPTPIIDTQVWRFRVFGLVVEEKKFTWDEFLSLPQVQVMADFHCVTRWSQLDNLWEGIPFTEVMKHIHPRPEAQYVMVHCYGDYTTNLPLDVLLDDDVLFAHSRNGAPLPSEHGGPMRLIVPKRYAWKSAKWVNGLEFMAADRSGFWETHGYHNDADPWEEERFG